MVERAGGSEAGWGINFAHQGDVIFATWFTYDASGNAWYMSMTAASERPRYLRRNALPDDRAAARRRSLRPESGAARRGG